MNFFALRTLLAALSLAAVASGAIHIVDPTVQGRAGYDSNPVASGGATAAVFGDDGALTFVLGAGVGIASAAPAFKAGYALEAFRFDGWKNEDFTTHKFSVGGQAQVDRWKFTADGSALFVAGSPDTLPALAATNANAITLWRERRRQWQYRLKAQAQADFGPTVVRATASLLAYDYQTRVVAGKFAFADRSDVQAGLDAGWRQAPSSLFLAGIRGGTQHQAMVPLPNCAFDYSNTYTRLALAWEGKARGDTTVTFAAGPDFRHYSGQVDPVIFTRGRNRSSLWFEGSLVARPTKTLVLTGKATRLDWLSSTGKSAYADTSAEIGASLKLTPRWTARLSGKVHRCDYFPVVRDDWETFLGGGVTWAVSDKLTVTADLLRHRGWNAIDDIGERQFHRTTVSVGATFKL